MKKSTICIELFQYIDQLKRECCEYLRLIYDMKVIEIDMETCTTFSTDEMQN